jgi:hypothetical protein
MSTVSLLPAVQQMVALQQQAMCGTGACCLPGGGIPIQAGVQLTGHAWYPAQLPCMELSPQCQEQPCACTGCQPLLTSSRVGSRYLSSCFPTCQSRWSAHATISHPAAARPMSAGEWRCCQEAHSCEQGRWASQMHRCQEHERHMHTMRW